PPTQSTSPSPYTTLFRSQDGRPERSNTYLIPARHGRAVRLDQGQHLKIINTYGTQVCDMWAFHAHSLREFLSMEHVRPWLNRMTDRKSTRLNSSHQIISY